jgi:hypothetical protein
LLLLFALACARTKVEVAAVEKHGGADEFAEMDFWDAVAKQPAICNSDAIHALMLSFGVKDPGGSGTERYAARLAACRERGWIGGKDEPRRLDRQSDLHRDGYQGRCHHARLRPARAVCCK